MLGMTPMTNLLFLNEDSTIIAVPLGFKPDHVSYSPQEGCVAACSWGSRPGGHMYGHVAASLGLIDIFTMSVVKTYSSNNMMFDNVVDIFFVLDRSSVLKKASA